jgi:hypothetical protein
MCREMLINANIWHKCQRSVDARVAGRWERRGGSGNLKAKRQWASEENLEAVHRKGQSDSEVVDGFVWFVSVPKLSPCPNSPSKFTSSKEPQVIKRGTHSADRATRFWKQS